MQDDGVAFSVERHDSRHLSIRGDLDAATAPIAWREIHAVLLRGVSRLTVDLAEVEYIDSVGLSALIRGHLTAQSLGSRLVVVNPRPNVRRVLEIGGTGHLVGDAEPS
jgi:anti-anti-sigma factor